MGINTETLDLFCAVRNKIQAITTTYTVKTTDRVLWADSTAGAFTATLPAIASCYSEHTATAGVGQQFAFLFDTDNGDFTIACNGAETIGGSATYVMTDAGDGVVLMAGSGTDWQVVATGPATAATVADGAVTTAKLAADAVDGTKLADDAVDSEHIADGSIDTAFYAAGSVDAAALGTNAVTTVKINADAVTNAKLADDSVDSDQIVDGAVDRAHLAADAVNGTKLADDCVDSEHLVALGVDREHLALDIIDGTLIEDDAVDSEHLAAGGIDAEHISNGACTPVTTEAETTNTVDTNHTVLITDRVILFSESDAGAHTITFPDTAVAGHVVTLICTAATTGSYTTSGIDSGEVTFDTANQAATFVYDEAADGWYQVGKAGPTMIDSADLVAGSVDTAHIASANITTGLIADGACTPVKTEGETSPTKNTNYAVLATDRYINLTVDDSGAGHTITFGNTAVAGHTVTVAVAASNGTYTTVGIDSGEVAFTTAYQTATFCYDEANDVWTQAGLAGPTMVQTANLAASAVTTAKIAADNITSALIADDQVDSEHINTGAVDADHMSTGGDVWNLGGPPVAYFYLTGVAADAESVVINSRDYEFDTGGGITGDVTVNITADQTADAACTALASAINGDGSRDMDAVVMVDNADGNAGIMLVGKAVGSTNFTITTDAVNGIVSAATCQGAAAVANVVPHYKTYTVTAADVTLLADGDADSVVVAGFASTTQPTLRSVFVVDGSGVVQNIDGCAFTWLQANSNYYILAVDDAAADLANGDVMQIIATT
jgi:hypothetical protein